MKIIAEWYTGFGFSIEANECNMYALPYDDQPEDATEPEMALVQFNGTIINLPFVKIHIGSFEEVDLD